MRKLHVVLLILFLLGLPAWAGVVGISVEAPNGLGTALLVDSNDALAVAWYQPVVLNSVSISINFQDLGGAGTYSAYLTDGIGPGSSDLFNGIATNASFTAPTDEPGMVEVFGGLSLGPGQYYLVIGTTDTAAQGGWSTPWPDAGVVTTNFGITRGDVSGVEFWASGTDIDPYLPASNFSPLDADSSAQYGDLLFEVSVPEPSTLWLTAACVLWFLWLRRRGATA
jgi:hypothetical protein